MHINVEIPTLKDIIGWPTLKDLISWIKGLFTTTHRSEIEDYLAQATDLFDLERRMTILARKGIL